MAKHHYTTKGCYYTEPSIYPKNWKTGGVKSLCLDWRIQFYFFDPKYAKEKPYGKLCVVKGMNDTKDLKDRRELTRMILKYELKRLENGFNYFSHKYMIDDSLKYGILQPELKFIKAFRIAHTKLKCSDRYLEAVKYGIDHIEQAAIKLNLQNVTIYNLKRRELKMILETCKLTNDSYNRHKCYVSSLFNELVEYECCEQNLTRDIGRKQTVKKVREIMTKQQMDMVFSHLKKTDYNFYRFAMIFMLSGSRMSELLRIKDKIDLDNQEYRVVIKKGRLNQEVIKVIITEALPYWNELINLKKPGQYLFSKNLAPGDEIKINRFVSQKWKRQVKQALGITADFYSLKHSYLDTLDSSTAQMMASHTSGKTTAIYQVNQAKRDREKLKTMTFKIDGTNF